MGDAVREGFFQNPNCVATGCVRGQLNAPKPKLRHFKIGLTEDVSAHSVFRRKLPALSRVFPLQAAIRRLAKVRPPSGLLRKGRSQKNQKIVATAQLKINRRKTSENCGRPR